MALGRLLYVSTLLVGGCIGCATTVVRPTTAAVAHDEPVPDTVKRAKVGLVVDLNAAADCEMQFDLELYKDRGVDLIAWDRSRGCSDRGVDIRYFPERLSEPQLLKRVDELTVRHRKKDEP